MSIYDDRDYRDEGIGPEPKPVYRKLAEYHPWTEELGLLLYQVVKAENSRVDPEIVSRVQSLERSHPVLTGHIWQLIEAARNPINRNLSADERLCFYARMNPDLAVPMVRYCVYLPLNEIELHNLLQGERV